MPAAPVNSGSGAGTATERFMPVADYALGMTLDSGQAFRWREEAGWWEGVIGARWVRLAERPGGILAQASRPVADWSWLTHYLQTDAPYPAILASFPRDPAMAASVAACRGLRLLRQDPWECLASFIASSTKQIVQIRQIVELLSRRYGSPVPVPAGHPPAFSFPPPDRLAGLSELELRACKLGFRAPYLLAAAQRAAAGGSLDLEGLGKLPVTAARQALMSLPGVGEKIANCVLLFGHGFPQAFPIDVWVERALRQLYFRRRRATRQVLAQFVATYFGPNAGYAQQYLFHYIRTTGRTVPTSRG